MPSREKDALKGGEKMDRWKVLIIVILLGIGLLLVSIRSYIVVRGLEAQAASLAYENGLLKEELGYRDRWIEEKIDAVRRLNKEISVEDGQRILREIWKEAHEYTLPPDLVLAMVCVESAFDSKAVSTTGALGLMQVMPRYHPLPAGWDPFNIETNIAWGCTVLANYEKKMGDINGAIRAYYAGEKGAQWKEAEEYLHKVMDQLGRGPQVIHNDALAQP
jgi:soluble lytic murein transglycosylase-like protein